VERDETPACVAKLPWYGREAESNAIVLIAVGCKPTMSDKRREHEIRGYPATLSASRNTEESYDRCFSSENDEELRFFVLMLECPFAGFLPIKLMLMGRKIVWGTQNSLFR
jgi:hypothetical protein